MKKSFFVLLLLLFFNTNLHTFYGDDDGNFESDFVITAVLIFTGYTIYEYLYKPCIREKVLRFIRQNPDYVRVICNVDRSNVHQECCDEAN